MSTQAGCQLIQEAGILDYSRVYCKAWTGMNSNGAEETYLSRLFHSFHVSFCSLYHFIWPDLSGYKLFAKDFRPNLDPNCLTH